METSALEVFFSTEWKKTVDKLRNQLDPDDRSIVDQYRSWNTVQEYVLHDESPAITLIRPALGHLNNFTEFFHSKLGPTLDVAFLWGSLTCLLKVIAEDPAIFGNIPRMIKSFAHRAEAFNSHTSDSHVVGNLVKESCFDIQVLFVDFFVAAVIYVHGADEHQQFFNLPMRIESMPKGPRVRYLMLPHSKTTRFFNRVDVFLQLDECLAYSNSNLSFHSVALHGLGGVGKSTIASSYLQRKYEENEYDVCLWVRAEGMMSLRQSFTDIAFRLKLPGAQHQSDDENLILVKDWLHTTGWFALSGHGRAIITTRDRSLAFEPASFGLEVSSWDGQKGSEFLIFLLKRSIGRDTEAEENSALVLSQRLSGHALAIQHMAALIHDGEFSIQEFMNMYLKDPRRAHASNELTALWDFSFQALDKESFALLGVIAILMPDGIPQQLFEHQNGRRLPEGLEFCADEFSLSAALRKLITLALIKRDRDTRILSIHRVVQAQFKHFLKSDQQQENFNRAVTLLRDVYPGEDSSWGQLYHAWDLCNTYTPHVIHLKGCYMEELKKQKSPDLHATTEFSGLLGDCQRYLYETNALAEGENMCEANLAAINTMKHEPILESLGKAERALEVSKEGYEIRVNENPQKLWLLCLTAQNIGFMSNTANRHGEALTWFDKSHAWWEKLRDSQSDGPSDVPALLQSGHARAKVYVGDYDGATELMNAAYPKIMAGEPVNWAMLGYMQFVQGVMTWQQNDFAAAEELFIKTQNTWLKAGEKGRLHPFNGGCMYRIGMCCLKQGKIQAASRMMPLEHARNLFALSLVMSQDTSERSVADAESLREQAKVFIQRHESCGSALDEEDTYSKSVPIFWR
ncbi:NB-ARC and TPR domain protein [Apiospora marii]|uniref:NB-ARC and TPR domain protein n=1 Tax=Apiospora marii TaxID=335849 RepID=A0ABR1RIV0_9PEZI